MSGATVATRVFEVFDGAGGPASRFLVVSDGDAQSDAIAAAVLRELDRELGQLDAYGWLVGLEILLEDRGPKTAVWRVKLRRDPHRPTAPPCPHCNPAAFDFLEFRDGQWRLGPER